MGGPLVGDADDERDRQATVTDFLDYTEHLPADVERSLTLLKEQSQLAQQATDVVHQLLQRYGRLPRDHDAYESAHMRKDIAYLLDMVKRRRECNTAEAHRLHEVLVRHQSRLGNVILKMMALPRPPSRDPTPQPTQKSPQAKRNEAMRLNLKADSHMRSALPKRRMIVPGEVLPPWNPDSQVSSDYDEFDDEEEEIIVYQPIRKKERIPKIPRAPREPKAPKEPKMKKEKAPKLPGQVGTNVHSSVAGISTSNALSLLTPPPDDAKPGSKFAPWFRLTEWEMATLRKRMKKNAIWAPSDTMIRRELVDKGRGHEAYQRARRMAEEAGETLLDEDDVQGQLSGLRELKPGEISADAKIKATITVNKGMDLNVRKKEKKAAMAQAQAAMVAQQGTDFANQSLANLSQSFRTLFDRPDISPLTPTDPSMPKGQKRKRDSAISPSAQDLQLQAQLNAGTASSPTKPSPKKPKAAAPPTTPATPKTVMTTSTTTTTVPTAPPAPSPIKPPAAPKIEPGTEAAVAAAAAAAAATNKRPVSSASRRMSLTLHMPRAENRPVEPGTAPSAAPVPTRETRQSSRPSSARASAGPMEGAGGSSITRQSPRLKSATPVPTPTTVTAPAAVVPTTAGAQRERRSKRPAPGPVTASQEGGAAVAAGRRKSAPKKKGKLNVEEGKKQEEWLDEEIDPEEPRYCVCNNVSYGTMIMCENPHCEGGEWFHLECVRLKEPPGRREKWWCPKCDPGKQQKKR